MGHILIGSKVMTLNGQCRVFFFNFVKNLLFVYWFFSVFCIFCVFAVFCICVITFEPIKIKTRSASQNDHLNLSFVKDDMQMAEIWLDMAVKWQLVSLLTFETPSSA